jgi:hypothetical protein
VVPVPVLLPPVDEVLGELLEDPALEEVELVPADEPLVEEPPAAVPMLVLPPPVASEPMPWMLAVRHPVPRRSMRMEIEPRSR